MKNVLVIHFLAPALCLLPAAAMAAASSERIPWWLGAVAAPVMLLLPAALGLRATRPRAGAIAAIVFLLWGGGLAAAWVGVPGELVHHHLAGWRGPGSFEVADHASSHFPIGLQVAWGQLAIPCVLVFLAARVAGPRQEPWGTSRGVWIALALIAVLAVAAGFAVRARYEAWLQLDLDAVSPFNELAPLGRQLARFDAGFDVEPDAVARELVDMAVFWPEMANWQEWTGRMILSRLHRVEHRELLDGIVDELIAISGCEEGADPRAPRRAAARRWLIALGRFSPLAPADGWVVEHWPAMETLILDEVVQARTEWHVHFSLELLVRHRAQWTDPEETLERAASAVIQALQSNRLRGFRTLGVCHRWPDLGEWIIAEVEAMAQSSPDGELRARTLVAGVMTSGPVPSREDLWVATHAGYLRAELVAAALSGELAPADRRMDWWMEAASQFPEQYPLLELLGILDRWIAAGGASAQTVIGRWLDPSVSARMLSSQGQPLGTLEELAAVLALGRRSMPCITRRIEVVDVPLEDPVLHATVMPGLADSPFPPVIQVQSRHVADAVIRLELDPTSGESLGTGPLLRGRWQLAVPLETAMAARRARLVVSPAAGAPEVFSEPFDLLVD